MIFIIIGLLIVTVLVWIALTNVPAAPARISQPVQAFDNQYEVFREMEPSSQIRENPWVGFLQENVNTGRTGPIGVFTGSDSKSGNAPLYMVTA